MFKIAVLQRFRLIESRYYKFIYSKIEQRPIRDANQNALLLGGGVGGHESNYCCQDKSGM